MTDKDTNGATPSATNGAAASAGPAGQGQGQGQGPRFGMNAQYVKDLSFESPNTPAALFNLKEKPRIDLSVDIKGQRVQEELFEISLHITAKALSGEDTVFLVDLTYGALVAVANATAEQAERLLLIEAPFVMFPFARRVVADVTRDGGFPPLLLEPIDFFALYERNRQQSAA